RLPDVLDKVVQAVCKIVPCAAVGIFGRIEDDMFATIRIADGVAEQATEALMREMILHYEHEATEKVNISTLQFNVERAEGKRLPSTVTKWGDDDLILLPLRGQDEIMGVLAVGQHPLERMDADHNAFLQSLADQASLILHRLHSAAIAQRAQLTAVLDALGTGIVVLTADRKIVTANQVARRMLAELNPAGEHQALEMLKVWDLVERAKENAPQPIAMDINIAGRYYEVTVSQWTLEASHGNRFAVSIRDVTKERLSQQQLIETGRLAALGELASGIAHEINNPLTAVVGFAELWLDREELDDQLRADLAKIYQAGMRARDIVHRLLIFARGVQEEKAHDVIDIPAVVDQALDLIAAQFRSAGIKLVRDYQRDLPVIVASQSLLQQVLLNLVQNAKDAIEMSGKGSQVIVRVQRADKEYIRIVVEDDGPGIPEEVRDKIYNPFFTTKPPGKGTGLGLSITYKHVQDMGGQIRFSTQEGVGTRFEVLIPIMSPEILPEVESEEEPQTPKAPFPARLLVVDDEPAILSLVQQGLTAYGYEVTTISDPREVIPCLTEHQFDVILLDLRMPHINGRELYEKIKKQFPEQAERVVFLTGDILGDAAREGQIAGRPTILKPLGAAELAQFLSQWLTEISQTPSSQSNAGGTQVN
ncbi:MAG TPA: response regulator, partial [Armatimonadetes bacterium]|nr:response regulator [Armatimonadota bacterium]